MWVVKSNMRSKMAGPPSSKAILVTRPLLQHRVQGSREKHHSQQTGYHAVHWELAEEWINEDQPQLGQ